MSLEIRGRLFPQALGKNMMDKTLTNFGWFICSLIEVVDTFYLDFKNSNLDTTEIIASQLSMT